MALSTNKILQAALVMANRFILPDSVKHLDIGSGHGDLIELFRTRIKLSSDACDYTDELMQLSGVNVSVVDLNIDKLPYHEAHYDLVTCTEVIEHLAGC